MATLVIDPGHGGSQSVGNSSANNAKGPSGTLEKDVTLDIALRLKPILDGKGHNTLLTRDADVNLGLADRAKVAANSGASAFLSIHFNGDTNSSTQGSETWVHSTSTRDSRLLAASVQQRVDAATGYANRGVKSKGLGVLSLSYQSPGTAACLVEISFLTDPNEEQRLGDDAYKNQVASSLALALTDFLSGSTSGPAVPTPEGDPSGEADG